MRTQRRIGLVIGAVVLAVIGGTVGMIAWLGGVGALVVGVTAMVVLALYRWVVGPWQRRWGATAAEVAARLPGDDLLPGASSTTRAIGIAAPPAAVWPWLVQLGYGRGGWYSYDWLDNDGRPSATSIVPELQNLAVGDRIVMVPGMGPVVQELVAPRWLLAGDGTSTWCLALTPVEGGTRLVSRWRAAWPPSLATTLWMAVGDPGAFIMERKMLKNLKDRVEMSAPVREALRSPGAPR